MNDIRRPWTFPALVTLVILACGFGVAEVAGLTPHDPIEAATAAPEAVVDVDAAAEAPADAVAEQVPADNAPAADVIGIYQASLRHREQCHITASPADFSNRSQDGRVLDRRRDDVRTR